MNTPSSGSTEGQDSGGQWGSLDLLRLNAFGFGVNGVGLAMDVMVLPALTLILVSDQLKNTYLGLMGFSGLVLAAVVQLSIGPVSDRANSRLGKRVPFIIWSAALLCLGLVAVGLAPNFMVLFAAWLFVQGSINVGYGPYQALIQDLIPAARVAWASSYKILTDSAGALVLIFIAGELIGQATGQELGLWLWLALGTLGASLIITGSITSLTVLSRENHEEDDDDDGATGYHEPPHQLHPQLARFVISRLMLVVAISSFQTYGLFFLKDVVELEHPAQTMGRMIVVIGGALAVSVYLAGWVSSRVGRKPVALVGAIGAAVSTILMLATGNVWQVLTVASLIGFSAGALLSADWALANELGTSGREALHMGIINLANIGGAALAKLFGPGIDAINRLEPTVHLLGLSYSFTGYSALLLSCGVLFLGGALLLLPLKPEIRERRSSQKSTGGTA